MIHRPFDEDLIFRDYSGFPDWKIRAKTALDDVMAAVAGGAKPEFKASVYGDLKEHLFGWFFGKCAYCESNVIATDWGDVEHYRPKRAVKEDQSHPGYYWLAYEPSNLLPSCKKCNQGGGKMNNFPVAGNTRAFLPAEIPAEIPLLLSPYWHRPNEHLAYEFDFERGQPTGNVVSRPGSALGEASVRIYNLNRQALVDLRLNAQMAALTAYEVARISRAIPEFFDRMRSSAEPYLGARASAIRDYIAWTAQRDLANLPDV